MSLLQTSNGDPAIVNTQNPVAPITVPNKQAMSAGKDAKPVIGVDLGKGPSSILFIAVIGAIYYFIKKGK